MKSFYQLEVPVYNIESALAAYTGGADRLELCASPAEGGITPSYAMIEYVKKNVPIPVNVMIRPRGGDFLYSDDEFEIMKKDIEICKSLGVNGVVFGILLPNGNIDRNRCKELVALSQPLTTTFHRAIDRCAAPLKALEDIIDCGFERILTSGQHNKAIDGIDLIRQFNAISNQRIIIMPGSGVNEDNIAEIALKTTCRELHSSASEKRESAMLFIGNNVSMETISYSDNKITICSEERVRKMKEILSLL